MFALYRYNEHDMVVSKIACIMYTLCNGTEAESWFSFKKIIIIVPVSRCLLQSSQMSYINK